MAWNIHWQCCFQSLGGTQYAVNIYEQDYDGSIVQLTGSDEPFVTQEDDDDDVFTPIRTQTGYLRVIDFDGTLLEELVPDNNTQRLVRLMTGSWQGTWPDGSFIQDPEVKWRGFLEANAYTQAWENNATEVSIPVRSLLSMLDSVTIDDDYYGRTYPIAQLIVSAFSVVGESPAFLHIISNLNDIENDFLHVVIQTSFYFSDDTVDYDGIKTRKIIARTYSEILSGIASLYGVTFREKDGNLYVVMYDNGFGKIGRTALTWRSLITIAEGYSIHPVMLGVPSTELTDFVTFTGSNSTATFLQGAKNAYVTLNLSGPLFTMNFPPVDDTADAPIEFTNLHTGTLYVQPHVPLPEREQISYYRYYRQDTDWTYADTSSYTEMLSKTVINGYYGNPWAGGAATPLYAGAFPCRWLWQEDSSVSQRLKEGVYINTRYRVQSDTTIYSDMRTLYLINSGRRILKANRGWIRIDFKCDNLLWIETIDVAGKYGFDSDAVRLLGHDTSTTIYVELRVGNKYYTGEGWSTSRSRFSIQFKNNSIIKNISDYTPFVEEDGGWFIPINEELDGPVSFGILDFSAVYCNSIPRYCYTHILSDLKISLELVTYNPLTVSDRRNNTYYKHIIDGFSEDKEITLEVGTMNNNDPNTCFILRPNDDYIDSLKYYISSGEITSLRPERSLLNRLVALYGMTRRTYKANIAMHTDPFLTYDELLMRLSYLGRYFFEVKSQTNWRDDTEDVKFIEVTE